ncbi:MAG: hypothetical protein HY556_06030 [Euryarchaeota archaeon]|nr:hypothetical protein [Euryarchaeota archaeon]
MTSESVPWPGFDLRGRGARRLFRQTYTFFSESKYLLQLVRHQNMVGLAFEEGWTHVGIGENTEAEIRASDFHMTALQVREEHRNLCSVTMRGLADPKVVDVLEATGIKTLREWVSWYRG